VQPDNSADFKGFLDTNSRFLPSESIICRHIGGVMDSLEGRLIRIPLLQGALSADAVFEDMLSGWKQQQLARDFTAGTIQGVKAWSSGSWAFGSAIGGT
jgi:hypothetical protein